MRAKAFSTYVYREANLFNSELRQTSLGVLTLSTTLRGLISVFLVRIENLLLRLSLSARHFLNQKCARSLLLLSILALGSCSIFQSKSFYYKTYTSPTLGFSIEYPKNWKLQEGGGIGSQVIFYSDRSDENFKANANIVVTKIEDTNLDALQKLSISQLKLILNQYELITQNSVNFGKLNAFELRGKYIASEGSRVIRTVVALDQDTEYVFTFTAAADSEKNYTQIVNYMIQSFNEKS